MRNSAFLDTNGWLAILNSVDPQHAEADQIWRNLIRQRANVVLTDWVIAETGNGWARSQRRDRFVDAVRAAIRDPRVELVRVDGELLDRSLEFFAKLSDKSWGLVDCASFLVMRQREITEAFTSDVHFEQAGFKRLLTS
jgi:uncharacterized protein